MKTLFFFAVVCSPMLFAQDSVRCSSDDGRRHYCSIDTSRGVRLSEQISGSACVQGSTWGYDSRGVWVDRGCRAAFVSRVGGGGGYGGRNGVGARNGDGGGRQFGRDDYDSRANEGGNFRPETVRCSSDDERRHYCNIDVRGGVRLVNQISGTPCRLNETWGYDNNGVWVDRGCRAEFSTGAGNRASGYNNQGYNTGYGGTLRCASDDGDRHYCSINTRGGVTLIRQISGSPCERGRTWDVDRQGIWVDRGCRAEFQVGQ